MRTSWAIGLAALVAMTAGGAGAAGDKAHEQHGQQAMKGDPAAEATKHVAVIDVAFDTAETNAEALTAITKSADTYDRTHGQVFTKNINDSLAQAKAHLAHLKPLATSEDQKKRYQELEKSLAEAETMARGLEAKLGDPAQLNKAAMQLDKTLDGSDRPLQQLARDMNARFDVG